MTSLAMPDHEPRFGRRRWEGRAWAKAIYNASPWYLQNMLVSAYGLVLHRYATSSRVQQYLSQLIQSQWLTPEELVALQSCKLRVLIEHAYNNVPYYREVLDDLHLKPGHIQKPADLQKLPLLSKQDVRQNLDRLIARNVDPRKLHRRPTSGTTGTPLLVYQSDTNEASERALWLRLRGWAGWQPGEKRATFFGYMVVPPERREPPLWRYDRPERRLLCSVYHMARENVGLYLDKLREYQPKVIEGYPSYLSFLALHLERAGQKLPVHAIFTYSETLYPHQRRLIEDRFACKIFDWYGLTEKVASAVQCGYTDGYHVNAEKTIVEIIKPDGTPAAPGEYGEIVGTNLDEYGMPLLRYRSGDVSAYRPATCACGRGLPLIEQVQTRVDDIITTPDGRLINPAPLAGLFRQPTIEKARIIQQELDQVEVLIVAAPGYAEADSEPIERGIRAVLGPEVNISVKLVEDIPCTASGKYPFIVSKVPLKV